MENQSQNQNSRRQRDNRSNGRSRSRQGNQNRNQNGSSPSGRNRSRRRPRNHRGSSYSSQPTPQSGFAKFLSIITFGLFGKPKAKSSGKASNSKSKPKSSPQAKSAPTQTRGKAKATEAKRPNQPRTEVTSGRLYVGNLDYSTGEAELMDLFRGAGNVLSVEIVTNPHTQQSKGFAFVEMGSIEEAKRAVSVLDDQEFTGRRLVVSGARSEGAREKKSAEVATSSEQSN